MRLRDDKALAALIRGSHVRVAGESRLEPVRVAPNLPKSPTMPPVKPPRMNKTETAWAMILEARKRAGEILWYEFEGLSLKLADGARFTPDFPILTAEGKLEFFEVKGFWREAAKLRIRVAASLYPFWKFYAVRKIRKKDGGGWDIEGF